MLPLSRFGSRAKAPVSPVSSSTVNKASIFPCVIAEMCEVDHMNDEDIIKKAIELHIIDRYEGDE